MVNRQYKKDRRIRGRELHVLSGRDLAAQKRMKNPLTELTPKVVRNLYETYRKGFMADIQLNWDAIEEYDETLGTVVDRRQSALGEMDWDVRIDQRLVGDNAALQELAEQQRVYMAARFNRVGNLMEAVKWLGMANFRRATFVQVFEQPGVDEEVWRRVPPWCISHPDHEGPWVYDEAAATYPHKADEVLMEHVIFREVERPIDLPCLALVVAKNMGITNWDGFLDTFGIPAVMVKMPPDTTDERREEFMDIAREIIGDGRGVFPDGTEINTIEATQNFANSFTERVDWCDKAMVRRATGGMLTVLAESGSGTLAGSAHMEAFRQLAANDAASVAECINRQYVRRVLAAAFPGQPALVRFELIPPVTDDRAAQAQILATLAGAGFKPSAEVVSEMMGFEVAAVEQQQSEVGSRMFEVGSINNGGFAAGAVMNSSGAAVQVGSRKLEVGSENSAPPAPSSINGQLSMVNGQSTESEALSEAELSALQALASGGLSADSLQGASQAIAGALQSVVTNSESEGEGKVHENGTPCKASERKCPLDHQEDDKEPWEKRQEEREHLEELRAELDRQEEAARDAEASGDPAHYNEEAARDRWSALSREGDPQTREDIEKRLAELDAHDSMANAGVPENRINQIFSSDAGVNTDAGFNHPSIGNTGNWESLGLGSATDFTHDAPLPSDKKEGGLYNSVLEHGFDVNSVDGKPVTFDKAILEHWDEEGKTTKDKEGRLKHLPDAIRTIRAPHEVWELDNGQRAYIRAFSETVQGGKGETKTKKSYISSFVVGEDGKVRSYVYTKNPGTANSARKGTLRYKR